jgi:hypothetical protein
MTRFVAAGLLACPLLLAATPAAQAQNCNQFGCGRVCMYMFPGIHQHGPLVNYGPYTGYYPFEPYGPWTADLRYNGPRGDGACGLCGRRGCGGGCSLLDRLRGKCGSDGCGGGWGSYAKSTFANVFHRTHCGAHKCGKSAPSCDGCGHKHAAPAAAGGCAGCHAALTPADTGVVQTAGRRER